MKGSNYWGGQSVSCIVIWSVHISYLSDHSCLLTGLQDRGSSETAIFVQGVIPGSTAEKCALLNTGDKILAIDGQRLDGADYIM